MNLSLITLVTAMALLILPGCEKEVTDAPPEIRFGQDLCAHCNMIISDERFAAASLVRVKGERKALLFDDIGDMIKYHESNEDVAIERQYVHDHDTKRWIEFSQAHFVTAPEVHTPMGSGILAYASRSSAQSAAEANAGSLSTPAEITEGQSSPKEGVKP